MFQAAGRRPVLPATIALILASAWPAAGKNLRFERLSLEQGLSQNNINAIVEDRRLAGSAGISTRREGGVVPLAVAQDLFGAGGQLTMLAVSNKGDTRGGLRYAGVVEQQRVAHAAKPQTGDIARN